MTTWMMTIYLCLSSLAILNWLLLKWHVQMMDLSIESPDICGKRQIVRKSTFCQKIICWNRQEITKNWQSNMGCYDEIPRRESSSLLSWLLLRFGDVWWASKRTSERASTQWYDKIINQLMQATLVSKYSCACLFARRRYAAVIWSSLIHLHLNLSQSIGV